MTIHRFGLISDTHGRVHRDVHTLFKGVDLILHAGDVGGEGVISELRLLAGVCAVAGNVDYPTAELPQTRVVDLPFGRVGLAHGHRYSEEREARIAGLLQTFKPNDVRIVMHGHSHRQFLEYRPPVWVVNPGAACAPRFGATPGLCVLEWDSDRDLLRFDFQPLDWR